MEHGAKKVKEMEWREQQLRLQPPKPAPKVDTREELIDQVGYVEREGGRDKHVGRRERREDGREKLDGGREPFQIWGR